MIIGAGHFLVKLFYLANNNLIFITNHQYIVTCYRSLVSFVVVCRAIERGGPGEVSVSRVKPEAAARRDRVRISGLARPLMPKPWGLPREAPGKAGGMLKPQAHIPRRCHAASDAFAVAFDGDKTASSIAPGCHQSKAHGDKPSARASWPCHQPIPDLSTARTCRETG